jgi:UDP-N-acetylglucosamine acyltransferase
MSARIHPTAIVDPSAVLHDEVTIGPYCIIGPAVTIKRGTTLVAHVQVERLTEIGEDNTIYGPSNIGFPPQDLKYKGESTRLTLGDRNLIREYATFHRGTPGGGGHTTIGNDNMFMAYAHVAHDCHVGNHCIFANAGTLAGHVEVDDWANIGAFSAVHQFCRVGRYAFMGGFTAATQDVLPYVRTTGARPARAYGINTIGLKRKNFPEATIENLRKLFRILFQTPLLRDAAIRKAEEEVVMDEHTRYFIEFVRTAKRGVVAR